ncbi:hypothetical protein EYF80_045835 [Liparis tanakae]|uniref:Uncharacterized protein n=1 Tax=Liparis tanakae TaxID=230148 RepID=A0A4Z2FSY3_9TELE|nr:hypothetical protein EYF80_045835 [Liparis tanakae]
MVAFPERQMATRCTKDITFTTTNSVRTDRRRENLDITPPAADAAEKAEKKELAEHHQAPPRTELQEPGAPFTAGVLAGLRYIRSIAAP